MNEIEKKFFETFEIPKSRRLWTVKEGFKNYYPEITDRIIIELFGLYNKYVGLKDITGFSYVEIRSDIIIECINCIEFYKGVYTSELDNIEKFKQEVQALFKEAE